MCRREGDALPYCLEANHRGHGVDLLLLLRQKRWHRRMVILAGILSRRSVRSSGAAPPSASSKYPRRPSSAARGRRAHFSPRKSSGLLYWSLIGVASLVLGGLKSLKRARLRLSWLVSIALMSARPAAFMMRKDAQRSRVVLAARSVVVIPSPVHQVRL